jgi:hypothetical protein
VKETTTTAAVVAAAAGAATGGTVRDPFVEKGVGEVGGKGE